MNKILIVAVTTILAVAVAVWVGFPKLLTGLGLHAHYEVPSIPLEGRRALIVTTSHDVMDSTGEPTGVWSAELTVPYYAFEDNGLEVDVASIQGGTLPIDPQSLEWPLISEADRRFLEDPDFREKVSNSIAIDEVVASNYDIVFLAGGWGAAYDFSQSEELGTVLSAAYANDAIVGGVCHGPLGLLQAKDIAGEPLVLGRRISAVSDKQIEELDISHTPMHPERDLRAAGAVFESNERFLDIFATHVAVDDRLITGQNQNSGAETAHRMMEALYESQLSDS